MSQLQSRLDLEYSRLTASEKRIISEVGDHKAAYIKWPAKARLL